MRIRIAALSVLSLVAAACSSATTTPAGNTQTDSGTQQGGDTQGTDTAAPGDSGPPVGTTGIGPIAIDGGDEKTQCIYKRLGNVDPLMVTHINATLATGTHHVIVYATNQTTEQLTPFDCSPFTGLLGGTDVPVMIATRDTAQIQFPTKVGYPLAANQMLKFEMHMINTSHNTLMAQGTIELDGMKQSDAVGFQDAAISFWGTTKITIPAMGSFDTGKKFQKGIAGTKLFEISTHQHQYGTLMQVWASPTPGTTDIELAHDDDWANPHFADVSPEFSFDGTSGLTYECQWENTSATKVTFGESAATNEMCFAIGYYYPAHGFDLCFDGNCMSNPR